MKDICANCGGWKGLHHYETGQCPRGGGENNDWQFTVYQEEDSRIDEMRAEIKELKRQVENLLNAVPQARR